MSVVITSYNYERYLRATIDSALNQTYRNTEVIVVDDGSTDSSPEIIASYGDSITAVLRENGGEAAASRSGLDASRGEIVLFLDSDDLLDPAAVRRLVQEWRPGTVKAHFYLRAIDGLGRPRGYRLPNIDFVSEGELQQCLFRYGYYPSPPTSGNAYARTFLLAVLPESVCDWTNGIDGYLNGLAPLHGSIVQIATELGSYRVHDRNMSAWTKLSVERLREGMLREIERERAIIAHAAARAIAIRGSLVANIPAHCKARILSLRLDRATHPVAGDTLVRLFAMGVASAWRFPHMRLRKRVIASAGMAALLVLPRRWIERWMHVLFVAEQRPSAGDLARMVTAAAAARARAALGWSLAALDPSRLIE
ncbi:MAG: glycosyltransferase family 2 protein [Gemmatimonas sp.]